MHDTMTTEKIKNGDIVTVEVWGVDNHYKAGAQASIYVGSNPPADIVDGLRSQRQHARAARESGEGRQRRRATSSMAPTRSIARRAAQTITAAAAARWA